MFRDNNYVHRLHLTAVVTAVGSSAKFREVMARFLLSLTGHWQCFLHRRVSLPILLRSAVGVRPRAPFYPDTVAGMCRSYCTGCECLGRGFIARCAGLRTVLRAIGGPLGGVRLSSAELDNFRKLFPQPTSKFPGNFPGNF